MAPPDCNEVVVFNYAEWISQYPEFANTAQPVAQSYFNRATLVIDNTRLSPIQDLFQRTIILNLATAHIGQLSGALNNGKPPPPGRVSSANQGSVSVSLDYPTKGGALAVWWNQTSYGAQVYAMTLQYRTAVYFPPPPGLGPTVPAFGPFGLAIRRR